MAKKIDATDIVGKKFARWTVLKLHTEKTEKFKMYLKQFQQNNGGLSISSAKNMIIYDTNNLINDFGVLNVH